MKQEKNIVGARGLVSLSPATIENIADKTAERVVRKMKEADGRRHGDLLVGTREAAKMLGISPATLRRRVWTILTRCLTGGITSKSLN